jgi:hypothetical protein
LKNKSNNREEARTVASEQDIQAARRLQGKLMADIDTAAIPFIADAIAQARQEGEAAGRVAGLREALAVVKHKCTCCTDFAQFFLLETAEAIIDLLPPDTATITTQAAKTSPD